MTSIMLFSSAATKVSPKSFAALPPHAQCELVLLLLERRLKISEVARAIGRTEADVRSLRAQKPLYHVPNPDRVAPPEDRDDRVRKVELTGSARRVLRLFAPFDDGILQIDRETIARRADLSAGAVKTALDQLRDHEMIVLNRPGKAYSPAIWALREKGRDELARLLDGDAHA